MLFYEKNIKQVRRSRIGIKKFYIEVKLSKLVCSFITIFIVFWQKGTLSRAYMSQITISYKKLRFLGSICTI